MNNFNEYINQWQEWTEKTLNALQTGDIDNADQYATLAHQAHKDYLNDNNKQLEIESLSFGEVNKIFENNLPKLFKTNKKVIKEYVSLLKNDKNLMAEKMFFDSIMNIKEGTNAQAYIDEALSLIKGKIDTKTIKESNKKASKLIASYRNVLDTDIDADLKALYESCNYILVNNKKISNLNEMTNKINDVANYAIKHAQPIVEAKTSVYSLIEAFDKKYGEMLNEDEKTFVQEIIGAKKASDNAKQEKLYNKFKNECINQINKMLDESNDTEKASLLTVKEQILNKSFCTETLVADIAKLLEIRDILMSE